jgi:site-specific DNA-cytosine methylase
MNVLGVFNGNGTGLHALKQQGIKVDNYFVSEIDKYANIINFKNHPESVQLGDVRNVCGILDVPKIDLLIGGSPCQGFSFAGKQLNFDDPRSALFFEYVRLLAELRLSNPDVKFLLENVRMKKESKDVITSYLGVEPIEINSALVSAQNRKRLYWTNIEGVTQPEDRGILLRDIVHEYALVDRDKAHCLDASYSKGANWEQYIKKSRRQLVKDAKGVRMLTPVECERLQTLPDIEKNCIFALCIDQAQNYVDAVLKNPRLQKLALIAEKEELNGVVSSALKNMSARLPLTKHTAQASADTQIQKQTSERTQDKVTKYTTPAEGVERTLSESHQNTEGGFADLNVFINITEGKTTLFGAEVPPPSDRNMQLPPSGNSRLKVCGDEIMQLVEGAPKNSNIYLDSNFTSTMLSLSSMSDLDLMLVILFLFAKNATTGYTQGTIEIKNISIHFDVVHGYTYGVSNSQRYKMLGNGWTSEVIQHIFSFLKTPNE